jgi:hypothetical protein
MIFLWMSHLIVDVTLNNSKHSDLTEEPWRVSNNKIAGRGCLESSFRQLKNKAKAAKKRKDKKWAAYYLFGQPFPQKKNICSPSAKEYQYSAFKCVGLKQ